jgi:catechol 2,3-dioxygenase-like lactoylglutathione lyase family enzyme
MSRVQLALNVDDLAESIAFYRKLFGVEPAKQRPGYANFAIAEPPLKLVLLENPGQGGTLNHLGVEVADAGAVDAEQERLAGAGLAAVDERGTTCCYARQDKFWVKGAPGGERWEIYTVLQDSSTFWRRPRTRMGCCAGRAGHRLRHSSGTGGRAGIAVLRRRDRTPGRGRLAADALLVQACEPCAVGAEHVRF